LSFHPTSTVSSARAPQACCILQPTMGFTAFLPVRRSGPPQASRIAPSSSRHLHQRRSFPAVCGPRSPSQTTLRRFSLRRSRSWLSSSERGVLRATLPRARPSSLTSACARVSGWYRALSSRSMSRGPSPPKWSGPGPSPLAVADPHLLPCWWLHSRRLRAGCSAPAVKRLASPLDLRVFFRDGVRCDLTCCQVSIARSFHGLSVSSCAMRLPPGRSDRLTEASRVLPCHWYLFPDPADEGRNNPVRRESCPRPRPTEVEHWLLMVSLASPSRCLSWSPGLRSFRRSDWAGPGSWELLSVPNALFPEGSRAWRHAVGRQSLAPPG
jgi:hypothetical protein